MDTATNEVEMVMTAPEKRPFYFLSLSWKRF
jgi:hypothetical protein